MPARVLLIDDDQDQCDLLGAILRRLSHQVEATTSAQEALEKVESSPEDTFDVILTDLEMTEMSGIALCERIITLRPNVPVIVVTGYASVEAAIGAMRGGAYDFLTKPVDAKLLNLSIARALERHDLQVEVKRLREAGQAHSLASEITGQSPSMTGVLDLVARVAESEASVLIHGETGTGKELVARAIHDASARKSGPFVAINCAAVPPTLLESELFGHAKGAFTDARSQRSGLFVQASGGTLFLDEIGEMPADMQAKLLRVLQERTVRPVGSDAEVSFDARLLTAAHRDLESLVGAGSFRQDLFYRINVVRIDVPPLRARGGDILKLADVFLRRFCARTDKPRLQLSPAVADRLMAYDWPGNVRELENCMERVVALARQSEIALDDLPENVRRSRATPLGLEEEESTEILPLEEVERRYILRVIRILGGNKTRAADLLGLDRRTLYRRLEKYEEQERRVPAGRTATGQG